jgi:hypothetical protein
MLLRAPKKKRTPTYLEGQFLAHGGESPSTLVPYLVATAPPFDSCPFHPTLHYLRQRTDNHGLLRPGQLQRKVAFYSNGSNCKALLTPKNTMENRFL